MSNVSNRVAALKSVFVGGLTLSDLHIIGKQLLVLSDEDLVDEGHSAAEIDRGNALFNKLDALLCNAFGSDWPRKEVL